jgi:hypothetical protein
VNQEQINKDLAKNKTSEFQSKILDTMRQHLLHSSSTMSSHYEAFDRADLSYRGKLVQTKDDKKNAAKDVPGKLYVPLTYAKTQAAVGFLMQTYSAREFYYELRATGAEDSKGALALSTDLQYQLTHEAFPLKQYCFFLDVFKYGFGVMKVEWLEKKMRMRVGQTIKPSEKEATMRDLGIPTSTRMEESVQEVLTYQGNELTNISPYNFFVDSSVPLARFQEGQFVAHCIEKSRTSLVKEEGKMFFGTEHIPEQMPSTDARTLNLRHSGNAAYGIGGGGESIPLGLGQEKGGLVVICEMVVHITPSKIKSKFGVDIGDESAPVKFLATMANNSKLIRFERYGYLHDKYPYIVAEFSPDTNNFYNPGLCETLGGLQEISNFLISSHVANVKDIIQNRFIVDPTLIEIEDIKSNSRVIRRKQSGSRVPLTDIIKQLDLQDVTRSHISDTMQMFSFAEIADGISQNAMAQYASGRRSATEARNVAGGAAARLKLYASLMWSQAFEPLGIMLLANTRQGRTEPIWNSIIGEIRAKEAPFSQVVLANPEKLAGGYDLLPYDSTLPTEKTHQAQFFQELMSAGMRNPQTLSTLGLDPVKIINLTAQLLGIPQLEDVRLSPEQVQQNQQTQQQNAEQEHKREIDTVMTKAFAKAYADAAVPEVQVGEGPEGEGESVSLPADIIRSSMS